MSGNAGGYKSPQRRRGSAGPAAMHRQRSQRRQASFRSTASSNSHNSSSTPTMGSSRPPSSSRPMHNNKTHKSDGFGQIHTRRASTGMSGFDPFDVGNMASLDAALQKKQQSQQGNNNHTSNYGSSFGSSSPFGGIPVKRSGNSKSSDPFDPFGTSSTSALDSVNLKRLEGLRKAQGMKSVPRRRAPPRSASIGSISKQDLEDFEKSKPKDDDLAFDDVDWGDASNNNHNNNNNNIELNRFQSRPRARPKSTSRRHSMDSSAVSKMSRRSIMAKVEERNEGSGDDDGFGEIFKAIQARGQKQQQQQQQPKQQQPSQYEHPTKQEKKKSGKSRRQSLDSALAKTAGAGGGSSQSRGGDDDGFGEVKSFGFGDATSVVSGISAGSATTEQRPGMVRRNSVSRNRNAGDAVSIASWKSAHSTESNGSGGTSGTGHGGGRSSAAPTRRGLNRRRSADLSSRRLSANGGMTMKPSVSGSGEFDYETETTATPSTRGESPLRAG